MENIYEKYFMDQVGSGIAGYSGTRYQQGNGMFGTLLNFLKPAMNYNKRQGLDATTTIASNMVKGENFRNAAKNQFFRTSKSILNDSIDKMEKKQKGRGIKRKKSIEAKKVMKKAKKRKTQIDNGYL